MQNIEQEAAQKVLRDAGTRMINEKILTLWEKFEAQYGGKEAGIGTQSIKTPLELVLSIINNDILLTKQCMKNKDVCIFTNYDIFVTIKLLKNIPGLAEFFGMTADHFDYKSITLVTNSIELRDAPASESQILPGELMYVENIHDVAKLIES